MTKANPTTQSWLDAYKTGELRQYHRLDFGNIESALKPNPVSASKSEAYKNLSVALENYHHKLGAPKAAIENAKRLGLPGALSITTGQQAGLLTGPAYTFYKAISAINLAKQHNQEQRPVVPVFWLASQDHDSDEIANTYLLDLNGTEHELQLPLPKNVPAGQIKIKPEWIEKIKQELQNFSGKPQWVKWISDEVKNSATAASNYADWCARLMLALLGPHGLVVLDPMSPEIAPLMKSILEKEILNPLESPNEIETAAKKLISEGLNPELRRQPNATNIFFEDQNNQRYLLKTKDQKIFEYNNQTINATDLLNILNQEPSRISAAAGLRPIIQDWLLPNAITVVGPGELAYHMELLGVYKMHQVAQPLLWPRLGITWLETPVRRALKRFEITAQEYMAAPTNSLNNSLLSQNTTAQEYKAGLIKIQEEFKRISQNIRALDPGLAEATLRSEKRMLGHATRLEKKLAASLMRKNELNDRSQQLLQTQLLPQGTPQERRQNFLGTLMKFGPQALEQLLLLPATGHFYIDI